MRRAKHRATAILATAAVAALVPVTPAFAAAAPSVSANVATVGSAPAVPYGAHAEGATPLDQSLSFDVVLKPRNQAALDSFVQQVSTPGSPQYRHFLAPGEYAATFGPTTQAIASVKSSLAALGLKVNSVTGSVISVSGSVAQVGSALQTSFTQYQLSSGRIARANTSAPKLPITVAPLVQGVVGLDDLVQLNHGPVEQDTLAPQTTAPVQTCLGPGSGALGYYNEDQLASYYGLSTLYSHNTYGDGIHVALFELEPFRASDIAHFQSCYGTSALVNTITVGGVGAGDGGEATLDIEDVIGLAPAATVDVYEGPNSGTGIVNVYNKMAT
ncbi:MAG TPA: protease pro-enzyme activation domain-containing protein, partial [Acidothermaceae bacterium]|nr:protease pro-enzyme activation domain-containing protein [Acidothermaceae bacterium]